MAREAAAQHYLTDAFAAGHARTSVASIRRYWKARYPSFWANLQRKVASDTAAALRELSLMMRLLPHRFLYHRTLSELTARTSTYPQLSMGDLVARAFHDWDNAHGLEVDRGGVVFGDGHVDEGVTRALAFAGVRAGNDDVEVAFDLGASGTGLSGVALYARVREATGAWATPSWPKRESPGCRRTTRARTGARATRRACGNHRWWAPRARRRRGPDRHVAAGRAVHPPGGSSG